jgi:hypothetical protein
MKLPRMRFTVQKMMVIVAVIGLICFFLARSQRLHKTAKFHEKLVLVGSKRVLCTIGPNATPVMADIPTKEGWWHQEMKGKYELASKHPWFPVAPDPPEPKDMP